MPLKAKMRVDKYECLSLKTTHHVWGGVEKKALPWTCASQSAQPRCDAGQTKGKQSGKHGPCEAILMSHMQGQEVGWQSQKGKRGISQEKPGARDHDHESEGKKVRSGQNRATNGTRRGRP